ncbi:MAG: oxygenase MpaB family protein [Polyangiaceae bacterium]
MNDRFSDETLDEMRERGDPEADAVISAVFADGETQAVNGLMASLVRNDGIPSEGLPEVVRAFLTKTSKMPDYESDSVRVAQETFAKYGPEVLVALGFYALPAAYAAKKGVQVLYRTAYLAKRPMRRVFETTQMVIDVLSPGGLAPDGAGVRTAQKVRLMHAAVRHLLLHDPERPWAAELGVPINQEDLAGTLMTFSYLVLDGLERLNVSLSDAQRESYQHAWGIIARIMGIHADLVPSTVAEAKELTTRIYKRQIAASDEGKALMTALLEGYEDLLPATFLKGVPRSLVHYFLDADPVTGSNISDLLGVPPADWTETVLRVAERLIAESEAVFGKDVNPMRLTTRRLGLEIVDALMSLERGGARPPFRVPADLRAGWFDQGATS